MDADEREKILKIICENLRCEASGVNLRTISPTLASHRWRRLHWIFIISIVGCQWSLRFHFIHHMYLPFPADLPLCYTSRKLKANGN